MFDDDYAPKPRADVDFGSLQTQPTPGQYFLLSRVDGNATVKELCRLSGASRAETLENLKALAGYGLIERPPGATTQPEEEKWRPHYPVAPEDYPIDEALLASNEALDEAYRREAICLDGQLSEMTHYELFGVSPEATRKQIKRAFVRLSKQYHPDKFFRQELGAFEAMLERIFKHVTDAYRVLSKKKLRAAYDAELEQEAGRQEEEGDAERSQRDKKEAAALLLKRRGQKLLSRGEWDEAAAEFRKALALKRDVRVALDIAELFAAKEERVADAMSFVRAALKLEPRSLGAHLLMAELFARTGRLVDARAQLEKAAVHHPRNQAIKDKLDALSDD